MVNQTLKLTANAPKCATSGFTLLEMSIVLMVIALLIGGVLLGQNLVAGASMKDLMTDMDYYSTATGTFQEKYNALPGDMATATSTWGVLNATPATCVVTASTSKLTCNGDGNGRLDQWYERFLFFKHLSNAAMIKGSFTGTGDPAGGQNPSVNNIPRSSMERVFISAGYLDINPGSPYFDGSYSNFFIIGAVDTSGGVIYSDMPAISTVQAQEIDSKMDDGKPAVGIIRTHVSGSARVPNCASTAVIGTAEYVLTNTNGAACSLLYITGF